MPSALVHAIATVARSTPTVGIGAPVRGFVGTVIGTAPLRVQSGGQDVGAVAVQGYTPANGHVVLALLASGTWYVLRLS